MDKTNLDIKEKEIQYSTFLKVIKNKDIDIVGTKLISDGMVEGIHSDSFVIPTSTGFTTTLKLHLSDIERLKEFADVIEQTGFVYLDLDSVANQLNIGQGYLTAQFIKDMAQSENARVEVTHDFVNPKVTYQEFKISDVYYRLYRVTESATVYNELEDSEVEATHGVEILTTKHEYDGQTFLGRLKDKDINKTGATHVLNLLTGNTLLPNEIGGAYYTDNNVRVNLYNINYKGMQVIISYDKVSVLSSNSFINLDLSKLSKLKIETVNDNENFELTFYFGKHELTLYI